MSAETDHRRTGSPRPGVLRRLVSTDHKAVGLRYAVTSMAFLFIAFCLVMLMRWALAYPGRPVPVLRHLLGPELLPNGILSPDFYNQLGALHGTLMIFLAVVPLALGGFGNYLVPLMIGARRMAFPRLNAAGYWLYLAAGLTMLASFVLPGGAPRSGWTSYPPLAVLEDGQTVWLVGMSLLIASALLASINLIVTIVQLRAPGMGWLRLPFFVWGQLVSAFLLLLAFPPLAAAALMQLSDRLAGSSFFLPDGLVVGGQVVSGSAAAAYSGGGSPLLWQHLFWFLAHPEVYVLVLPALGIVAEVIAVNSRKPLSGYRAMVGAALFLGFMSLLVWAHHMFLTGMGTVVSTFFQATTMIISIPSVVILTALLLSLWGGSLRFTTPMLFALAFLPMFGLGGLTGLPLGLAPTDIQLHDTYYVIGHFHYLVAPGTLFALFAGVYHWFPKVTGRKMSERLGKLHFWPTLVLMNAVFLPMFAQGLAGVSRRLYDGGAQYSHARGVLALNEVMSIAAWLLAVAQLPFVINLFRSLRRGERVGGNPWRATTLEWLAPSPPLPQGNFPALPAVVRGPYEYSVPGAASDFSPQGTVPEVSASGAHRATARAETVARQAVLQSDPPTEADPEDGRSEAAEAYSAARLNEAGTAQASSQARPALETQPQTSGAAGMGAGGTVAPSDASVEAHPETGLTNARLGVWLLVAAELMLFGGLLSGYLLLRTGAGGWPAGGGRLGLSLAVTATLLLVASAAGVLAAGRAETRALPRHREAREAPGRRRALLGLGLLAGVAFLAVVAAQWWSLLDAGVRPAEGTFFALYFLLVGCHAAHLLGGLVVGARLWVAGRPSGSLTMARRWPVRLAALGTYWGFLVAVWLVLLAAFYLI